MMVDSKLQKYITQKLTTYKVNITVDNGVSKQRTTTMIDTPLPINTLTQEIKQLIKNKYTIK